MFRFEPENRPISGWRQRLYDLVFSTDSRSGQAFGLAVLIAIALSVSTSILETVESLESAHKDVFRNAELLFTCLFTIEYLIRILCVRRPLRYTLSLLGIIDLLSILPFYLGLVAGDTISLQFLRALRLLRIFRVLHMSTLLRESNALSQAIYASRYKVLVFLVVTCLIALFQGTLLYFVESAVNPEFANIPSSVYWAIVTMTTVGYGDIAPQTAIGKTIASILMLVGYGIIAVPTGIVTSELVRGSSNPNSTAQKLPPRSPHPSELFCKNCNSVESTVGAEFCKWCGAKLEKDH